MRAPPAILAATLGLLLAACGSEETPEERARAYIDQVVASAEARQWGSFGDYLDDDYRDDRGLTKKQVLALITRYILANRHIYILKRIASTQVEDPRDVHAVIYAAIAGQPVSGPQDLTRVSADIYRFEIDLRAGNDGVSRAVRGDWQSVPPQEFLLGR